MKEILEQDIPRLQKLLLKVLGASDYRHIERMGGLTNHTYKITMKDGSIYAVRLPGEGTETLINRADEKISTRLACDLDIDAKMLHFGEIGEKVTCYIEGAKTLSATSFQDKEILRKSAEVLRVLHTSGADTGVSFDVFDMAAGYEKIICDNAVPQFDGYAQMKEQIMQIRNYVETHFEAHCVPCHNDPLCENWVLNNSGKLYLIDWEYAGMNDAMWDLADVSIEADFCEAQEEAFLKFYFGREPEPAEVMRFHANKLYLDFLWALWGKTRVPFDGEEMEQYGQTRYERLSRNLSHFHNITDGV